MSPDPMAMLDAFAQFGAGRTEAPCRREAAEPRPSVVCSRRRCSYEPDVRLTAPTEASIEGPPVRQPSLSLSLARQITRRAGSGSCVLCLMSTTCLRNRLHVSVLGPPYFRASLLHPARTLSHCSLFASLTKQMVRLLLHSQALQKLRAFDAELDNAPSSSRPSAAVAEARLALDRVLGKGTAEDHKETTSLPGGVATHDELLKIQQIWSGAPSLNELTRGAQVWFPPKKAFVRVNSSAASNEIVEREQPY